MNSATHRFNGRWVENWARFVGRVRTPGPPWRPTELGEVLRHQLSAPWEIDHGGTPPTAPITGVTTLGKLFRQPDPPLTWLRAAKDFAKANCRRADGRLPAELAWFLYYLSIAVARVRCGQWISRLSGAELSEGFRWALDQPWVEEDLKPPLQEALAVLEAAG